jgi:hypothetical protein
VHNIVKEVCRAVIKILKSDVTPTPTETCKRIIDEFLELWKFPNCAGALDGKHVRIQAPPNSGSLFFNYKHMFSVVLLALVDA